MSVYTEQGKNKLVLLWSLCAKRAFMKGFNADVASRDFSLCFVWALVESS